MNAKHYLVIDIGGSSIKHAWMSQNGIEEKGEKIRTPKTSLKEFEAILLGLVDNYRDRIDGIAISAPGWIESDTGYFHHGGALQYLNGRNLAEALHARTGLRVTIDNDANCAALAELELGSMKDVTNGMVIVIGTGVGAGLILNHQLYRGSHFNAGEYGMMNASFVQREVSLGRLTRSHALLERYADLIGVDPEKIRGVAYFRKVEEGEAAALQALEEYCQILVSSISSVQALLDLEVIAIGGGYSREPLFLEYLNRAMEDCYRPFEPTYRKRPKLVLCALGNDANLYGALQWHLKKA